jgi:hypothetical protein
MGTRCEIVVTDRDGTVVLFKQHDGNPEAMVPFFYNAARFAMHMARDQKHLLTYAEDVAGYLIAWGGIESLWWVRKRGVGKNTSVMPVGRICDMIDYVYVLNVAPPEGGLKWSLEVYEVDVGFWRVLRRRRDLVYAKLIKGEGGWERYLRRIRTFEIRVDGEPEDVSSYIDRELRLIV